MMKNCIFTIVARNYVGLAEALERSIYTYNNDIDFYIVVADEPSEYMKNKFRGNVLIAKEILDYKEEKWYEMAFKYNLTEFCTSIKPDSVMYFMKKGYEKVIYFDPDILTFSKLNYIWDNLDIYDAIVTPHILTSELIYTGNLKETKFLFSGVYNMGFGAYKKTSVVISYLKWWKKRLEDYCFGDSNQNLFTDQKWVDMLPCFLGNKVLVSRHKGLNVAPWNFHERQIIINNNVYKVKHRFLDEEIDNLVFIHYSGYNYKILIDGQIKQGNITDMKQYEDLMCVFSDYGKALKDVDIKTYINETYSYNYFSNSKYEITLPIRRIYRGFIENGNTCDNPFLEDSIFYCKLKRMKFLNDASNIVVTPYIENSSSTLKAIHYINIIFKFIFRLLGASRYYNMTRVLRKYGVWENHSFLVTDPNELYKLRRM